MKRIINKVYDGSVYEFSVSDLNGFNSTLFAVLCGIPKKVSVELYGNDVVYIVDFA